MSTIAGWHATRVVELRALLKAASANCQSVEDAKIRVETTLDEIVDVSVTATQEPAMQCLVEAAWTVRLSPSFNRLASFDISL